MIFDEKHEFFSDIPVTKAFMPFLVPGTLNICVRLYEKPTKNKNDISWIGKSFDDFLMIDQPFHLEYVKNIIEFLLFLVSWLEDFNNDISHLPDPISVISQIMFKEVR